MRKQKVIVTQVDIDKAIKGGSSHCMVAMAIKRQFPNVHRIHVDVATIRWTNREQGEYLTYLTPRSAQQAICNFDQGYPMVPFEVPLGDVIVKKLQVSRHTKPDGTVRTSLRQTQPSFPTGRHKGDSPERLQQAAKRIGERRIYGIKSMLP